MAKHSHRNVRRDIDGKVSRIKNECLDSEDVNDILLAMSALGITIIACTTAIIVTRRHKQ